MALRPDEALQRFIVEQVRQQFANQATPAYVVPLVSYESVHFVMDGARKVLQELGLEAARLDAIPIFDLSPIWMDVIRNVQISTTLWAPLDIDDTLTLLIRRVAGDAYSMYWQSRRYMHFLALGPPAGVPELPAYSWGDSQKSFAVNNGWWQRQGKSWSAYVSCAAAGPSRQQSKRASHCVELEEYAPRAFV